MVKKEVKKSLGQFFTTNSDYILQGLERFIENKNVTDPFAGNGDLTKWARKNKCKKVIGFDYDKKLIDDKYIFYNDSINSPKRYKFIVANPPYLHKNKASGEIKKSFFSGNHSVFEDLYQVSIFSIFNSEEGILIVPLNFLSADNSNKIRNIFFEKFEIIKMNIFLEQVFDDTTYNVISFYYRKKKDISDINNVCATIYPEKKKIKFSVDKQSNWKLGGSFINKIKNTKNNLKIRRLTESCLQTGNYEIDVAIQNIKEIKKINVDESTKKIIDKNILFLRAIDSKNGKKIQLENITKYNTKALVGKSTSRNMAHIIFGEEVPIKEQEELMTKFNNELNKNREKYFSFFLTNFRDNGRKRISFDFTYRLLNYLYNNNKYEKQPALL